MENLAWKVRGFLSVSNGYGNGNGNGNGGGIGIGFGNGSGDGRGSGSGRGGGIGIGFGNGNGIGIKAFNGRDVHHVDGVETLITSVKNNIAKGYILNADLTTTPTIIAKVGGCFAHGESIEHAVRDATAKYEEGMPLEDRVELFLEKYPKDKKHSGYDLFDGHRLLTGSCEQGRKQFVRDRGIDLDKELSLSEFVELTKNEYGGEVVQMLGRRLG